jgi:DNA-binding MarR family transcriptional regulator
VYHTRVAQRNSNEPFRSLGFMLSTLGYATSRAFHRTLAPLELDPAHFAVLRGVAFDEGRSQQAFAEQLRISPSRMVAIVDDLERRELLERRAHDSDRRVRKLHLTERGRELLDEATKLAVAHEQRIGEALTTDERTELLSLLEKVAASIGLAPGAHAALRDDSVAAAGQVRSNS